MVAERPIFEERGMILGHESIIEGLKHLASKKKLAHGYVFFGPERVGKRLVALCFAHYLETGTFAPPGESRVLSDTALIEPSQEGAIGVDTIRELKYLLWQKPNKSPYRTVIIDRSDLLTSEAQNALLKVTEEPPSAALLILIVKEPEIFQPTLLSRLQRIYFGTVSEARIKEWLLKNNLAKAKEAEALATRSFGQPGRAIALLGDEKFQVLLESAQGALRVSPTSRRDFIKELIAPENFNFRDFMDALISCVAESTVTSKKKIQFWHELLELRREIQYFNLNPRLQLENLLSQSQ